MVSTVTPSGVVCGANSRHYPRVRSEELAIMHRHFFCSGEHFDRTASCDRTSDLPKPYCSGTRQLSKFRHRLDDAQLVFSTTYKWSSNCHLVARLRRGSRC